MPKFTLTNKAVSDLKNIGRYTQKKWGRDQRNKYLAMIDNSFHNLAENPLMGRSCDTIRAGYLMHKVGSHVIFYRVTSSSEIEIVRILHGRMDFEFHLSFFTGI